MAPVGVAVAEYVFRLANGERIAVAIRERFVKTMGYRHARIHHAQKVYVSRDVHTNTIDGFWALLKNGIGGVYHGVSTRHLKSYLDEFTFRYNNRRDQGGMFNAMVSRIEKKASSSVSPSSDH